MDERPLVAACIYSREAFDAASRVGLSDADLSEFGRLCIHETAEQYKNDPELTAVDISLLKAAIYRRLGKTDLSRAVCEFVDSLPTDVSKINAVEEYRKVRQHATGTRLATRLASGQHDDATRQLLDRYIALSTETNAKTRSWRLTEEDLDDDRAHVRIPIAPGELNTWIGGGLLRGHNVTVFGRPDSGKSLFALNYAAYAIQNGYKVLYVANEEPARDITSRLLARVVGSTTDALREPEEFKRALRRADKAYSNWFLLHKAACTLGDIREAADTVRPDIIFVDQLKNVITKEDNRALQLDTLARGVRELGIAYDAVTVSVTQAGESAHNQAVLQMNDIEWSNTGIPGAADLLIGIGVTPELDAEGRRMISTPKNKINGKHGALPVFVYPTRTAFLGRKSK